MASPDDRDDAPGAGSDPGAEVAGPDYLWDGAGPVDPEVARLEAVLAPLAHRAPLALPEVAPIARARRRRWPVIGVAIAAAAAAVVIGVTLRRSGAAGCRGRSGFAFAGAAEVTCADGRARRGTLAVGGWIETADTGARVTVADIGAIELAPRSHLALRGTGPAEHRLALVRGALHARVTAPPRLFVIETASATAIDLGCEYDLAVGADGAGTLAVTTGQVELAAPGGALVVVPARTSAAFTAAGVGLPLRREASAALRDAARALDVRRPATVAAILAAAGPGDEITLLNLLVLAGPYQRAAVAEALQAVAPAPDDVLLDAVIAGDREAIARWRASVVGGWLAAPAGGDPTPPMPPDRAPDPTGWAPQ